MKIGLNSPLFVLISSCKGAIEILRTMEMLTPWNLPCGHDHQTNPIPGIITRTCPCQVRGSSLYTHWTQVLNQWHSCKWSTHPRAIQSSKNLQYKNPRFYPLLSLSPSLSFRIASLHLFRSPGNMSRSPFSSFHSIVFPTRNDFNFRFSFAAIQISPVDLSYASDRSISFSLSLYFFYKLIASSIFGKFIISLSASFFYFLDWIYLIRD